MNYQTLENQLLKLSLLCGLTPNSKSTHRKQFFLLAYTILHSRNHQEDYQRTLESGVKKGIWGNDLRLTGQYFITANGYLLAQKSFPDAVSQFSPVKLDQCNFYQKGKIRGLSIFIAGRGRQNDVFINGERMRNAKTACELIMAETGTPIPIKGASAFTKLYNLALDYSFRMNCWFT
ncbi:MAG: hypothetical protein FJ320_01185 [SAR202 cluster bacterium]|nr:hypothetical protein [SAR202 cluster bacterium]